MSVQRLCRDLKKKFCELSSQKKVLAECTFAKKNNSNNSNKKQTEIINTHVRTREKKMSSSYDKICADIDNEFTRFCLLYDKYLDRYTEMGNLIRDVNNKSNNKTTNKTVYA